MAVFTIGTRRKVIGAIVLGLLLAALIGLRMAASVLKDQIVQALGPEAEIESVSLGWFTVRIDHLRIHAPAGWPAADTLRAEHITLVPDLRSLFSKEIQIYSIDVEQPYVSMRRNADGRLEILPSLLHKKDSTTGNIVIQIGSVALNHGVLEFFDATITQPPLKLRLENLQASVNDVVVPSFEGKMRFDLSSTVKGVQRDGTLALSGWINVASQDSSIKTTLHDVDLVALQPYLIKTNETGVKSGSLDLDLQSDVAVGRLKAPGKLSISKLQLAPAGSRLDTFMGIPRQAVITSMKDRNDQINVDFQLDGDIHNPRFSLNETLSVRLTYAVAQTLGLSVEGLVEGVGSLGERGISAVGSSVGKLLGLTKKQDPPAQK